MENNNINTNTIETPKVQTCSCCGLTRSINHFKYNPIYKKHNKVCNDCIAFKRRENKIKKQTVEENERKPELNPALSDFTPRQLMDELMARGYTGELYYVELKKVVLK